MPEMKEGMLIVFRAWGPCGTRGTYIGTDDYSFGYVDRVYDGIAAILKKPESEFIIRRIDELDWHEWPDREADKAGGK
jgi:hypothetical protein